MLCFKRGQSPDSFRPQHHFTHLPGDLREERSAELIRLKQQQMDVKACQLRVCFFSLWQTPYADMHQNHENLKYLVSNKTHKVYSKQAAA